MKKIFFFMFLLLLFSVSLVPILAADYNVDFGVQYPESISSGGTDLFTVTLYEPGRVNIALQPGLTQAGTTSSVPGLIIQWFDEDNLPLRSGPLTLPHSDYMDLEAGVYDIRISSPVSTTTPAPSATPAVLNYFFKAEFRPSNSFEIIPPNNTRNYAYLMNSGAELTGYISHQNGNFYYRYEIDQPAEVTVKLSSEVTYGVPGLVYQWLNSQGVAMKPEAISVLPVSDTMSLEPGVYYIRVSKNQTAQTGTFYIGIEDTMAGSGPYSITYNANGGSLPPPSQMKVHDSTIFLSNDIPSRVGYSFQGWSLSSTAVAAQYNPGDVFTNNEDTVLYAVWTEGYTINFNANGGTNAPAPQTKIHGQTLTLSGEQPSNAGFNFVGWATSPNAFSVQYSPNSPFNVDGNITLYAVWSIADMTVNAENSPSPSPFESVSPEPSGTPSPGSSEAPSPTPSGENTETPSPSPAPAETPTPVPSETPSAAPTAVPTVTPENSPAATPSPQEGNLLPKTGMLFWPIMISSGIAFLALIFGIKSAKSKKKTKN